jgi:hypothetical protein
MCQWTAEVRDDHYGVSCAMFEAAWLVAAGDGVVFMLREGIDRRDIQDMLRCRWPDALVKSLEHEQPRVMTAENPADLGRCRSGVEPLHCGS